MKEVKLINKNLSTGLLFHFFFISYKKNSQLEIDKSVDDDEKKKWKKNERKVGWDFRNFLQNCTPSKIIVPVVCSRVTSSSGGSS